MRGHVHYEWICDRCRRTQIKDSLDDGDREPLAGWVIIWHREAGTSQTTRVDLCPACANEWGLWRNKIETP